MSENQFIPRMNRIVEESEPEVAVSPVDDKADSVLLKIAQYATLVLFGALPIFFVPGLWASLGFGKTMLALVLGILVIISLSLLSLRRLEVRTILPFTLGTFLLVVGVAFFSGILSGDTQDALRGSMLETQTAAFIAVMALVMGLPLVYQGSKLMSIKALAAFGFTGTVLLVYAALRLVIGPDFLSLGSFNAATVTPIGSFNDLAIFAGLMTLLCLVTLMQLPLKTSIQYGIAVVILVSLFILAAVNFFNIWLVVGFFSFLMLVYLLSRNTLFRSTGQGTERTASRVQVVITTIVCIISATFVVAGDYAGAQVEQLTNVNYIEVRPSFGATIGIAKQVYADDAFFGIGANRFADAWRLFKERSINETIFWDTDFNAGSGFVPTLFVTLGSVGGILLVIFHVGLLYLGYRMLLKSKDRDSYWYYLGVLSFTAACFIWGMSYVYVPGAAILLLGAFFTGLVFVSASALLPTVIRTIPLSVSRQRGFVLMALVILLIPASVAVLLSVGKQYSAQANFAEASATAASLDEFEKVAQDSYVLFPDERFISARARVQLANLNNLLGVQNPTPEQQQSFQRSAQQALVYAEQAVQDDLTNPDYRAILAGVYNTLALAGSDGAQERAELSLAEAQLLDPFNPGYHLIAAQIEARIGDLDAARTEITKALELKRNYTEALYLSAQLDIESGNVESAIATTQAIITLEPSNPTRYFQLGVLLAANNQEQQAIGAYSAAIALDPQYANARYLLAIALLNSNQNDAALEQLQVVRKTNPTDQKLLDLIQQVESGTYEIPDNVGFEAPVQEISPQQEVGETTIIPSDVSSDLVTPVNTITEPEAGQIPEINLILPSEENEDSEATESTLVE